MVVLKILKFRKIESSKYKLFLDNGEEISFYEDVILKYHLLLTRRVSEKCLIEMNKLNKYYEVYYTGLRFIKSRFKSAGDLKKALLNQGYDLENIDLVIDKLKKQGYVNDYLYAKSFINNRIVTSTYGPKKVRNELILHEVDPEIIDKAMVEYDTSIQLEKIEKLAYKSYRSNKSRGGEVLKRKIIANLLTQGYELDCIQIVVDKLDYAPNDSIAKKEYDKLYKRLSRKYKDEELERKIKEKLYAKGLKYEVVEED